MFEEFRRIAADSTTNSDVVLVFNSSGGNSFAALRFLDGILGDEPIRHVAERARVKIYAVQSVATVLAFSLGCERELSSEGKIGFDLGERIVQVGNPDHYDQEGYLTAHFVERWREYRTAVLNLLEGLGIYGDLGDQFWAGEGRLDLSAQECLRRGLVRRLF